MDDNQNGGSSTAEHNEEDNIRAWQERFGDMIPERIIDTKIGEDGRRYYKVQWAASTMEPSKNFLEAELLIQKYWDPVEKKLKLPSQKQKKVKNDEEYGEASTSRSGGPMTTDSLSEEEDKCERNNSSENSSGHKEDRTAEYSLQADKNEVSCDGEEKNSSCPNGKSLLSYSKQMDLCSRDKTVDTARHQVSDEVDTFVESQSKNSIDSQIEPRPFDKRPSLKRTREENRERIVDEDAPEQISTAKRTFIVQEEDEECLKK